MRGLLALAALLLLVGLGWTLWKMFRAQRRRAKWSISEKSSKQLGGNPTVVVSLRKAGEAPLQIGVASATDEEFEQTLEFLRSEAQSKAVALNHPR